MAKCVFLSYASKYKNQVHGLAYDIVSAGHEVWLDRYALEPGVISWSEKIFNSVTQSTHFILFSSPSALKSKWVRLECAIADAFDIPRSIINLKTCEPVQNIFGERWNENNKISCYDLRSGEKRSSDWNRFIITLDKEKVLKNGLPQFSINKHDWELLWKQYHLPEFNKAWEQNEREPGHIKYLEQLEQVLNFFTKNESDKNLASNYIITFLNKYFYSRLQWYKKWYYFASNPETQLSSNILKYNAHNFSMRMTSIDPGPVLSMFSKFERSNDWDRDTLFNHAIMASYGADYE